MEQLMLGEFKGNAKKEKDDWSKFRDDEFENLFFESKIIKQFSLDEHKVFRFKERIGCKRGLNKKNELVFKVLQDFEYPDIKEEPLNEMEFACKDRQRAIDFFENEKFRCIWEQELNKENKVWDGRRYVLLLDKKDKVIKRVV